MSLALCSDTFNRANDATTMGSTDGAALALRTLPWQPKLGTWGINGNQAYNAGSTTGGYTVLRLESADVDLSVTVATYSNALNRDEGIVFRWQDANNHWRFRCSATNSWQLQKVSAGGATTVQSATISPVAGDVLRVVCAGPYIRCYRNGTLLFTTVDSTHLATGISHGIRANSSNARMEDWSALGYSIGATYSQDTFNRANNVSSLGNTDGNGSADPSAWTDRLGNLHDLSSNVATCQGPSAPVHITTINLGVANAAIQADFVCPAVGVQKAGILFRYVDNSNYWYAVEAANGNIELRKRVLGVNSLVASASGFVAGSSMMPLRVVFNGSAIEVWRNGTLTLTATDSFNSTATLAGMYYDDAGSGPAIAFDNWFAYRPVDPVLVSTPSPVISRGIYADEIAMGPGSTIASQPDWSTLSVNTKFYPFYNSNYGVMVNESDGSGTADVIPSSWMYLYRIDVDATQPTGYKFNLLTTGFVVNWNQFIRASNSWFPLTDILSWLPVPLNDRQIVFLQNSAISGGPYSLGVLTRNANNTLSWKPNQLITGAGGSVTHFALRYDDTHLARGYQVTASQTVEGVAVAADGTCSIVSTSVANSPEYAIVQYDFQDGFLLGNLLGSATVWARAWTPAGGYTGARINGTLPTTTNFGNNDGLITAGIESREMMFRQTSGPNMWASFNGTSWTIGTSSNTAFPFAGVNAAVTPYILHQHWQRWLTFGNVNHLTTSYELDYALTSESNAVPSVTSQHSTGISFANFGYQGMASVGVLTAARHTATLALLWGSFTTTSSQAGAFPRAPIAFATP